MSKTLSTMALQAAGSKRILSEEEWETLRPFIQLHYIDENKPFPQVARILREEYGFEPTKKQFTRRVEKWAMKKNVSQSERKDFLKGHPRVGDIGTADRRFHSAKIESWRKRHKDESASGYTTQNTQQLNSDNPRNDDQERQNTNMVLFPGEVDSMAPDFSFDNYTYDLACDIPEDLFRYEDEADLLAFEHFQMSNQIATLPKRNFLPFDWASVNITGPAGLTQLFRGLEIECSRPQELATPNHQDEEETNCISGNELQNLWNHNNHECQLETEPIILSSPKRAYQYSSLSSSYPAYSAALAPNGISLDFELYPFPRSGTMSSPRASPATTVWATLEAKKSTIRSRLRVLRQQSLASCHPLLLRTIRDLGWSYFAMAQYGHALKLYRQALTGYLKMEVSSPIETLHLCVDIVRCLQMQSKYYEAQTLLQQIFQAAKRLLDPEHAFMVDVRLEMADIYHALGRFQESEDYYKEILQLELIRSGPRSEIAKRVLSRLGNTLGTQTNRAKEGEKLLRTFLQLATDGQTVDICWVMIMISLALAGTGCIEQCAAVARQAAERCERELGPMHETTWEARYRLACSLAESGELTESEKLHRVVYYERSKIFGCTHHDSLNSAYSLGSVVEKLGRVEEATDWFEKALYGRLEILGVGSPDTIYACHSLGWCYEKQGRFEEATDWFKKAFYGLLEVMGVGSSDTMYACECLGGCYEKQGRFEDAIELYEMYLEKLRDYDEVRDQYILKCGSWIDWNLEQIRERDEKSLEG